MCWTQSALKGWTSEKCLQFWLKALFLQPHPTWHEHGDKGTILCHLRVDNEWAISKSQSLLKKTNQKATFYWMVHIIFTVDNFLICWLNPVLPLGLTWSVIRLGGGTRRIILNGYLNQTVQDRTLWLWFWNHSHADFSRFHGGTLCTTDKPSGGYPGRARLGGSAPCSVLRYWAGLEGRFRSPVDPGTKSEKMKPRW